METIELTRAEIEALNAYAEKQKREVAREIFEEIEEELSDLTVARLRILPCGSLHKIFSTIAELKKKYTESENNNE